MALKQYGIGAAGGALLAFLVAWWLWHPTTVAEGPAFGKALPDGAVLAPRDPDKPVPPKVKAAAKAAGGHLERAASITVQPDPVEVPQRGETLLRDVESPPQCSCKPITVDLGLIRMPDHSRRVVATADGGTILSSVDIPIDAAVSKRETRWAAGVSYAPQFREFGAFLDRDLGPFRLGVEVQQRREGLTAIVRAGIRF